MALITCYPVGNLALTIHSSYDIMVTLINLSLCCNQKPITHVIYSHTNIVTNHLEYQLCPIMASFLVDFISILQYYWLRTVNGFLGTSAQSQPGQICRSKSAESIFKKSTRDKSAGTPGSKDWTGERTRGLCIFIL